MSSSWAKVPSTGRMIAVGPCSRAAEQRGWSEGSLLEQSADRGSISSQCGVNPLNPLAPPSRRLEGIREILCLAHDLTVAELHNTHCVCWSSLVRDCVFRNPEITVSENSLDVEA